MEKYWYCGVSVKGINTVYSYISDIGEIQPGTYVTVPFGRFNALRTGIVKSCGEYAAEEVPYPVEKTKHILREATVEEYDNQPPLPPYYSDEDMEDDLSEVDSYIETEDWEEVLEWAIDNHDSPYEQIVRKVIECYALCAERETSDYQREWNISDDDLHI